MAKELKFDQEARNGILEGVNILANAVKVTLGPNVTFTASAKILTPSKIPFLAS